MRQKEFAAAEDAELTYKPTVTKQSEKILRDSGRGGLDSDMTVREVDWVDGVSCILQLATSVCHVLSVCVLCVCRWRRDCWSTKRRSA